MSYTNVQIIFETSKKYFYPQVGIANLLIYRFIGALDRS
jgi:hypothetical protein